MSAGNAVQRFTELKVWQRSHALALAIYDLTRHYPEEERYGLTSQLRRAAVSVPANIAEGSKRRGALDYARFLNQAESSLAETEYLLILSRDLQYLEEDVARDQLREAREIGGMLYRLRSRIQEGTKPDA